jgi:hypothetical protein
MMDLTEMTEHLEAIARDEGVAASARVRAIEVLLRLDKQQSPDEREWARLVEELARDAAD